MEISLREILDYNRISRTEGPAGIENLNKLAKMLGYQEDGFRHGTSLERFLEDNPGWVKAIIEWIDENAPLWEDNLEEYMPPVEEEIEEDA